LRALGSIDEHDELTLRGRLLRSMFHPAGILIVEMLLQGVLDGLSAAELAEVCSWFTFDSDRRLNNHGILNTRLTQVRRELRRVVQHVHDIEQRARISFTPDIVPEFHSVALSWSRGMSLSGLLRRIDLAEGDILMVLNQTIDLLQQAQSAVGRVLDARDIWMQESSSTPADAAADVNIPGKRARNRTNQLQTYRERLERLLPLLAQASASLLRGIIIQSRTVPSMTAYVGNEELSFDSEQDTDPQDVVEGV